MSELVGNGTVKKRSKTTIDLVPIKEGFLVKKGHVRHNWKTRWFILYRDEIRYYKNRGEEEAAGFISLTGASLILSPQNNKKRDTLLQVTCGKTGREFLLQALDKECRDIWGKSIEKQIQSLQKDAHSYLTPVVRSSLTSRKLSLYELDAENTALDVRDIVLAMQDKQAGLELRTEQIDGKTYKNLFTGNCVVDWLVSWSFADNRSEGQRIGQDLITRGHIQSIDHLTVTLFRDQTTAYYRFVTLRQESITEPITDQTLLTLITVARSNSDVKRAVPTRSVQPRNARFFSAMSSESDLTSTIPHSVPNSTPGEHNSAKMIRSQSLNEILNNSIHSDKEDVFVQEQCEIDGEIILQGFLLKLESCHLRQTWKKRNFVLREGNNRITYFSGAKVASKFSTKGCSNEPTGSINLGNSTVISIESCDDLKHIFEISNKKGKKYWLAASSLEERDNWVKTLNAHIANLCPYKISYTLDNSQIV